MCAATCSWRVFRNLILRLFSSAASTAMLVWPQRPNTCFTPRASRYFTSRLATVSCFGVAALRVRAARAWGIGRLRTVSFIGGPWVRSRALRASGTSTLGARTAGRERGRQVAARRAAVLERNLAGHRSHDPATALLLLPGVGEDSHRAGEDEEPAPQFGLEAELAEDDGGDPVDVHRDQLALRPLQRDLDGTADAREPAGDGAARLGACEQLEQRRGARIHRMEPVAEAGHDLLARRAVTLQHFR